MVPIKKYFTVIIILIATSIEPREGKLKIETLLSNLEVASGESSLQNEYIELFSKAFTDSYCVVVQNRDYSSIKLNLLIETFFVLNIPTIINENQSLKSTDRCSILLPFGATASIFDTPLEMKFKSVKNIVGLIIESHETYTALLEASASELFDLFGFANVFFVMNGYAYQLSSPASVIRHFSPITSQPIKTGLYEKTSTIPNYEKKTLRVVTFNCPVNVMLKTINDTLVVDDGLEYRVFKEVAYRLNFTYDIRFIENDTDKWGIMTENGTWRGGIIGKVMTGQADVGFCGVWVVEPHLPFIDLTDTLIQEKNHFLVRKKPAFEWSWFAPFAQFKYIVWIFLCGLIILQALVLFMAAHISSYCPSLRSWSLQRYCRMSSCLMEVLGIHLLCSPPNWKRKSAYLVMIQFYALLITTSYTSCIVNRLLTPRASENVRSIQQLLDEDYYWGKPYSSTTSSIHYKREHESYMKKRRLLTKEQYDRALLEDEKFTLIVGIIRETLIKVDMSFNITLLKQFIPVPEDLEVYNIAFALEKYSYYKDSFNKVIGRINSSGLLSYWVNDLAMKHWKEILSLKPEPFQLNQFTQLSVKNIKGVFLILLVGCTLATMVFIFELHRYKKEIIKNNSV